jgi:hypothetical protein
MYGISLPASATTIYVVGLALELVGLAVIQAMRTRRSLQQRTAASAV